MNVSARKIESLIAVQNITKIELAKRAKIAPQSVSAIMKRGTCEPRTAGRIAAALGVDVLDIIDDAQDTHTDRKDG